jgi:DNA-binding transcriptional regulator YiaG
MLPWNTPRPPRNVDVRAIRLATHAEFPYGQASFAGLLGVSVRTLQAWESGRRRPTGPARALLMVIAHDVEAYRAAAIAAVDGAKRHTSAAD